MKKITVCYLWCTLIMLLSSLQVFSQTFQQKYFKDGMYVFDDLLKIKQSEIFTTYKSEFGLGADDEMREANNQVTPEGKFRTKYELYHKGIRVEGSAMNVIGEKGIVLYANGFLLTGLNVDINNIITKEDAIQKAISYVGAAKYPWQDSAWEATLKEETGDSNATSYPKEVELVIAKKRDTTSHKAANYQLCYTVHIEAIQPAQILTVYVNANTGVIFTYQLPFEDYTANGSVNTWYNGWHPNDMNTTTCAVCFNYRLDFDDYGREIYTRYQYGGGIRIKDGDNSWTENTNNGNYSKRSGATVHWGLQKTFNYYLYRHGRWGSDYNGKAVWAYIDAGMPSGANAYYDFAGNFDAIYFRPDNGHSAAMLDVIAHEYTHAFIHRSSDLGINQGDFDANSMREAYADIFGMKIEGDVQGWHDWTFAEHMGTYQRNFSDPHTDFGMSSPTGASAARYLEPGYWMDINAYNANKGVMYPNGGVLRKWFYLLSQGGTFNYFTVSGLGIEKATDIAYLVFNWWLWSNLSYPEMAIQTAAAVKTDYGQCSNEHKQTVKALNAVGFFIPGFFCETVVIDGTKVISKSDVGVSSIRWLARPGGDIADTTGTYRWTIPTGWHGVATGRTFLLTGIDDDDSKVLKVKYTDGDGHVYRDSIVVHVSDIDWKPINNPYATINKPIQEDNSSLIERNSVHVYPNPSNTDVTIVLDDFKEEAHIAVYDMSGRLVKSTTVTRPDNIIDISELKNGLYFIKVTTSGKMFTKKLSVIH